MQFCFSPFPKKLAHNSTTGEMQTIATKGMRKGTSPMRPVETYHFTPRAMPKRWSPAAESSLSV